MTPRRFLTPATPPSDPAGFVPDAPVGALFVSKSVPTRQVLAEGSAFTQVIQLKNTGTLPWSGWQLARVGTFGPVAKKTDALGASADAVKVPDTAPGAVATVTLALKAVKSSARSGAAQAAPWELRKPDGTKVPILTAPGAVSKGGCVWTVVTLCPAAAPEVPDLTHAAYTDPAQNRYVAIGYGGQCTAFVYGRVREKLGIALDKVSGSAFGCNAAGQKWIDQLTGPGKPYVLSQTPVSNSLAVWVLNADPAQGHVAFVESVTGDAITYNEANVDGFGSFASDNGPDSDSWGAGYDGKRKTATAEALRTHLGAKYTLRGYIAVA